MNHHLNVNGIDADLFRSLMRRIASSVAVITTAHDGHLHGMTATAVLTNVCRGGGNALIWPGLIS